MTNPSETPLARLLRERREADTGNRRHWRAAAVFGSVCVVLIFVAVLSSGDDEPVDSVPGMVPDSESSEMYTYLIKKDIRQGFASQSGFSAWRIRCPYLVSDVPGSVFQCIARPPAYFAESSARQTVDVLIQNEMGNFLWRIRPAGEGEWTGR